MVFLSSPIPCDFDKYPESGCEDSIGSYCDLKTSRCHCKADYPIRLFKYCLRYVGINETCYTSRQCNETLNAACYILGTEYDHSGGHNVGFQLSDWPEGKCRCRMGHQFDLNNGTCVKRTIGSWCNVDRDCTKENFHSFCNRKNSICECLYGYIYDSIDDACSPQRLYGSKCRSSDDCSRDQLVCTGGRCKCPKGSHWDAIYPGSLCKPNNDSACAYGYKWDSEKERCVLKIFKDNDSEDLDDLDSVGLIESDHRPTRGRGGGTSASGADGDSWSKVTIVMIFIISIGFVLVFLRYWYVRKREDSEEDLTERGHIRPILKSYYGDHMIHTGTVPLGPIDTNGIKCRLSLDDSVIHCDGMVKCTSTSSSPGQPGRLEHHHHPIHSALSDTIVPYDCPIGHCQGHCPSHLDMLECEVVGCHQINGSLNVGVEDCNRHDDVTTLIEGNDPLIITGMTDPSNDFVKNGKETKDIGKNGNINNNFSEDEADDGLGSLGNQESESPTHEEDGPQSVNKQSNTKAQINPIEQTIGQNVSANVVKDENTSSDINNNGNSSDGGDTKDDD
uniref:EB domain-containing protein n=2 Tax=Tetranychus urticae TaxID=32264 RepID=T1KAX7_TETUR